MHFLPILLATTIILEPVPTYNPFSIAILVDTTNTPELSIPDTHFQVIVSNLKFHTRKECEAHMFTTYEKYMKDPVLKKIPVVAIRCVVRDGSDI